MHELCRVKATEGNLLSIAKVGSDEIQSEGIDTGETSYKQLLRYAQARYKRSLLFFNTLSSGDVLIHLTKSNLIEAFNNYKLLRVLDIENIVLHSLPDEVGFLSHLRYLSLKGSWVSRLPSTIKNLRFLQTLDLRVLSFVHVRIPNVLWRLKRLLHLYLPSKVFNLRHKEKNLRLKGLINLETLSNFCDICKAEVEKLFNLRRFASSDFHSDDTTIKALLSPTSNLKHLERVALKLDGQVVKENSPTLDSDRLRKLWLKGKVEPPITNIKLSKKLTRLYFHNTEFQDDPMKVLGELPSLKKLSLKHASYTGTNMTCCCDSFKELKYLTLKGLESLQVWTVEQKAMPQLSVLKINGCPKLKMLPDGLVFIKSLQELVISFMPFSFFERNNNPNDNLTKWSQYSKVKHVPRINISYVLDLEV